jgi:predicted nucleic acid-binding protein
LALHSFARITPVQPWADCLDPIFHAAIDGKIELYVSTVVVSELLANLQFANRHNTGYDPELDLLASINRHFQILGVTSDVARVAGRLRGSYAPGDRIVLKTPDVLIGATSLIYGHTLLVTNDAKLADALPGSNCVYLRDAELE